MLALSVVCAVAAAGMFLVAVFELANIWWALLACAWMLAYVGYVASTRIAEPATEEERP